MLRKEDPRISMYVARNVADARKIWHLQFKHTPLSLALGEQETVYESYSFKEFHDLYTKFFVSPSNVADAVRIYFAAFPTQGDTTYVPNGMMGKLTLIYAACKKVGDDYQDIESYGYIFIHPKRGLINIGKATATNWIINQYRENPIKLALLTDIVRTNIPTYNETDTRSILHTKTDFEQLFNLIDERKIPIDKVYAQFTSYTNKESANINQAYRCRLTVDYELINASGDIVDLYALPNKDDKDYNNGVLCPPEQCEPFPL